MMFVFAVFAGWYLLIHLGVRARAHERPLAVDSGLQPRRQGVGRVLEVGGAPATCRLWPPTSTGAPRRRHEG